MLGKKNYLVYAYCVNRMQAKNILNFARFSDKMLSVATLIKVPECEFPCVN